MPIEYSEKPTLIRRLISNFLRVISYLSLFLLALAVLLAAIIFYPVAKEELKYLLLPKEMSLPVSTRQELLKKQEENPMVKALVPVNEDFGIVIPKISANVKVIPEVDSQDPAAFKWALTRGVAHVQGTALPSRSGNTVIFSHSSANFWEASRYNAIFYLLSNLETGDSIYLFYQGEKYHYLVAEKKKVKPEEVSLLEKNTPEKTLTLIAGWPPGTILNRLVIIAKPAK
jgi:sortase A